MLWLQVHFTGMPQTDKAANLSTVSQLSRRHSTGVADVDRNDDAAREVNCEEACISRQRWGGNPVDDSRTLAESFWQKHQRERKHTLNNNGLCFFDVKSTV